MWKTNVVCIPIVCMSYTYVSNGKIGKKKQNIEHSDWRLYVEMTCVSNGYYYLMSFDRVIEDDSRWYRVWYVISQFFLLSVCTYICGLHVYYLLYIDIILYNLLDTDTICFNVHFIVNKTYRILYFYFEFKACDNKQWPTVKIEYIFILQYR